MFHISRAASLLSAQRPAGSQLVNFPDSTRLAAIFRPSVQRVDLGRILNVSRLAARGFKFCFRFFARPPNQIHGQAQITRPQADSSRSRPKG